MAGLECATGTCPPLDPWLLSFCDAGSDANGLDAGVITDAAIEANTGADEGADTGVDAVTVDTLGDEADVTMCFELEAGFEATVEFKFGAELVGVEFEVDVEVELEAEMSADMRAGEPGRVAESERSAERSVAADTVPVNTVLDLELEVALAVDVGFVTEAELDVEMGVEAEVGDIEIDVGVNLGIEPAAGLEIMVVEVVGVEAEG